MRIKILIYMKNDFSKLETVTDKTRGRIERKKPDNKRTWEERSFQKSYHTLVNAFSPRRKFVAWRNTHPSRYPVHTCNPYASVHSEDISWFCFTAHTYQGCTTLLDERTRIRYIFRTRYGQRRKSGSCVEYSTSDRRSIFIWSKIVIGWHWCVPLYLNNDTNIVQEQRLRVQVRL